MTVKHSELTTYHDAVDLIIKTIKPLARTSRALSELLHCFTAEPIYAAFDLPGFDNSAVDGYGVNVSDIKNATKNNPVALKLLGSIQAGQDKKAELEPQSAIKILTGAKVPSSVEAVVMREFCRENSDCVLVQTSARSGENIRRQAEEFKEGDLVLGEGIQITPPVLGLIASFGHGQFPVANMPRIAIVSTGDELVKPGTALAEGQIYDSNSYMLAAAVSALGLPEPKIVHARDNEDDTLKAFTEALETADLVISAGGVSVGDHDYVKTVLEERLKVTTVFWRTAIKPGKPVYFSYLDPSPQKRTLIFGLPGNPVSALITFNLFVKPALLALQGARDPRITVDSASMLVDLKKKQGRLEFVRGILGSAKGALNVLPTRGQDSHMLGGLAKANCLIRFPEDKTNLQKGNLVEVEKLNWNNY